MIYNELGTTGMQLSKLSLGGAAYGGPMVYGFVKHVYSWSFFFHKWLPLTKFMMLRDYDASIAEATVVEAIHLGINYIDVAPHYGLGIAEKFLGKVNDFE